MPKPSPRWRTALTRPLSALGAILTCLLLPACASTPLSQPVKVVTVGQDCPRLTIADSLLVVRPITPIASLNDNGDMEDALDVVMADHERDRGQLRELTAAERQREADQDEVDAMCRAAAERERKAIEEASKESVNVRIPIWKRLGL